MLAAVVADSARRTYALFGQCRCGFCADDGAVLPNEGEAFGQCQRDRLGVPPPPLAGEGWGGGGMHESCCIPPPYPSPACGGGNAPSVRQEIGQHDHTGPTSSTIAASSGFGAMRIAPAPAAESGCATCCERQKCIGASARSSIRSRAAQSR